MNCPNCNTPNRDGGKFCISCGHALPQVQPAPAAPAWQEPTPTQAPAMPQAGHPSPGSNAPAGQGHAPKGPAVSAALTPQGPPVSALSNVPATPTRVVVTDVNMTFSSMVIFMVKWAIAAVPALIILSLIVLLLLALFGGIVGSVL